MVTIHILRALLTLYTCMEKHALKLSLLRRLRPLDWLIIALILLFLAPIWAFQYIPTQDGPSHLYNAQILTHYFSKAYNFQHFFSLRPELFPNWLSHASLALLMLVFPPLISEKIMLSLYVTGFPLATIYFLETIHPENKPLGLLSFAFIYNYLFMLGFWNFIFSVPLALWTLAYWWKHRRGLTLRQAIVLNLLLLLVYLGHLVPYLVVIGSIAFIAVSSFLPQTYAFWSTRGSRPLRSFLATPGFRQLSADLWKSLVSLLPTLPICIVYYVRSTFSSPLQLWIDFGRVTGLMDDLVNMHILVSYEFLGAPFGTAIGLAVACIFTFLLIITLIKRVSRIGETLHKNFRLQDTLLGLFLILFVLYLVMPWNVGTGLWLNDRLALLSYFFLLAWFDVSRPILPPALPDPYAANPPRQTICGLKRLWRSFWAALGSFFTRLWARVYDPLIITASILTALASLAMVFYTFTSLAPTVKEYLGGQGIIRPNSIVLPLTFRFLGDFGDRTDPVLHLNSYYTLYNGAIDLHNYEAFLDYFPVKYKPGLDLPVYYLGWNDTLEQNPSNFNLCRLAELIDYLMIWNTPGIYQQIEIENCYTQIYAYGRLRIYVPRK